MAAPIRSASGSVAKTKSAPVSIAFFIARSKAAGSSGFGDITVGKLPLITFCSGTSIILVKPIAFKVSGMSFIPVPCIGV